MVHIPFNDKCQNNDTYIVIGNCRSVPASPTDISVVYTVLVNIKKMFSSTGQDPAIITCDEGIYSLNKEAQWQVIPQLDSVILLLGGFHRAKKFVRVTIQLPSPAE